VLGGTLAALAGIVLAANQGSAAPDVAVGFLLPAFAAAFLSTVILSTGQFKVWGTLIGGTFLVWVSQGLIVGGLAFTWTDVVNGVVLTLAVALSTIFRRTA
jgi:ribose/xylose/arabinose/galactoside ABC-type transport system permease subunit